MAADFSETKKILSNPAAADPSAVASNIDSWITSLQPLGGAGQSIITDLEALKGALTATSPDGAKIGSLLTKLGKATTQAAAGNADLEDLGAQLSKLGT